jgi:hypothetical protein
MKAIRMKPMERDWAECPLEAIDLYFAELVQEVDKLPASLICNFDETEYGGYADVQELSVIIEASQTGENFPVS